MHRCCKQKQPRPSTGTQILPVLPCLPWANKRYTPDGHSKAEEPQCRKRQKAVQEQRSPCLNSAALLLTASWQSLFHEAASLIHVGPQFTSEKGWYEKHSAHAQRVNLQHPNTHFFCIFFPWLSRCLAIADTIKPISLKGTCRLRHGRFDFAPQCPQIRCVCPFFHMTPPKTPGSTGDRDISGDEEVDSKKEAAFLKERSSLCQSGCLEGCVCLH